MKTAIFTALLTLLSLTVNSYGQSIQFVAEDFAPFQVKENDKPLTGFAVELIEAAIKQAGIDAQIKLYPWARAYQMAQNLPNTFILTLARTAERESQFKWVADYYEASDFFFALSTREDISVSSIEDAKLFRTAVPRGDAAAIRLEGAGFGEPQLEYVTHQKQCLQMLYFGRVDLNSNNDIRFYELVKELNYKPTDFKKVYTLSRDKFWLAASLSTPEPLVHKMRLAIHDIKNNGTYENLVNKWFPNETIINTQ